MPKPLALIALIIIAFITLPMTGCMATLHGDGCPIGQQRAKAGNCVENYSCLETEKCASEGKCTWAQGSCVATSQRDCLHSDNCKKLGECGFRFSNNQKTGLCVADEQGCENSAVCAQFGKCSPGQKGFCVVDGDDDCAKAAICREQGRCTATRLKTTNGSTSRVKSCQR